MKKALKSIIGVTLLEIMLVLAIAAMIIVMSIRYYQSATYAEQSNVVMGQVQAIAAAMDNLALGKGSYTGITIQQLTDVVGAVNMTTPNNTKVTFTQEPTATQYSITMPLTIAVCTSVAAKLSANVHFQTPACDGAGVLTYTYDSTK